MNGLKRMTKGKTFLSLPDITGRRKRKAPALPLLPAGLNTFIDVVDDEEQELARALNDDRLARRIMRLKRGDYPYGTVPELIMLDFLMEKNERYKYQAQLFGGWRSGGLVPDFVVSRGGTARALLINGNYWHKVPGKQEKDASDKLRLTGSFYDGEVISDVTIVWESRLMSHERRATMEQALQGVEMPA
jgi:hypothetical protein